MKRPREAAIAIGSEIAAAITDKIDEAKAFDDVALSVYIQITEQMLAAAKEEQTRRLSETFLPPGGASS